MKKFTGFLAVLVCVLVLGFAATTVEARAAEDLPLRISIVTLEEGVEFNLVRNGVVVDTFTTVGNSVHHDADFTVADVPYLEVHLANYTVFTSAHLVVPLSDFTHHGAGAHWFDWPVTQIGEPPTTTTPTPLPTTRTLRFPIGSTTFTDNGASRTLEAAPFISGGRTMVPLRVIGEALGATDLALDRGVVSLVLDGRTITMTVGQPLPGNMGTPVIIAGRTFVPLAYIIEEMGATARWDSAARVAYIYID